MNDFRRLSDDPNLTAYALGELEGAERAAVEEALRTDPESRRLVEEIRAMAAQLETVFEAEQVATPATVAFPGDPYAAAGKRGLWRYPQIYYMIGGLVAACFVVVLSLHERRPVQAPPVKQFTELAIPPLAVSDEPEALPVEPVGTVDVLAPATLVPPPAALGKLAVFDASVVGLVEQSKQLASLPKWREGERGLSPPPVFSYIAPRLTGAVYVQGRNGGRRAAFAPIGAAAEEPLIAVNERPIVLSSFVVEASPERGYGASNHLAGGRLGVSRSSNANTESYAYRRESDFLPAREHPLSTFSADVDTASYANVRRMIQQGQRPPVDAVRIEEMLNYFPFAYAAPTGTEPFAATMEVAQAPWNEDHRLVRIGLKAREVATADRGAANLVFLLDVSGSMSASNRLPLVKESMRLLLERLREDDRVAIVTYAGASGLALPSTPVAEKNEILRALAELHAAGSTHGSRGIELAYDIAKANYVSGGINRVILCTDGDFNVGVTSEGGLVRLIEEKAKSGVFLTVLGFGMGNLKDSLMQQLADRGNGHYGYIDTRREAEKLLVEQVNGTLVTVAKDVKLQVEFNPEKVASYRLIGYEKRILNERDFANDKIDAGEIGAGHTVTALYEIVPVNEQSNAERAKPEEEELRYGSFSAAPTAIRRVRPEVANELLTLRVRYKEPAGMFSKKREFFLVDGGTRFVDASDEFKFASAVAGFGMILRGSAYKGSADLAAVANWAEAGMNADVGGYRAEFLGLIEQAGAL